MNENRSEHGIQHQTIIQGRTMDSLGLPCGADVRVVLLRRHVQHPLAPVRESITFGTWLELC